MSYMLFGVNMATKMLSENGLKILLCALVLTKWLENFVVCSCINKMATSSRRQLGEILPELLAI